MDLTGNGGEAVDMSQMPAGAPPPGVTPNLGDGAPSQQAAIVGTCTTFIVLTTAFVAMRLYVAFSITKIRGLDTCMCLVQYTLRRYPTDLSIDFCALAVVCTQT